MSFTISDLETMTGLKRRTIYYYTKNQLIPRPEGFGIAAGYREDHLLRLLLIREMKKSHLKLSGIREALEGLSTGEMKELLKTALLGSQGWDSEALKNWLTSPSDEDKEQGISVSIPRQDYLRVSDSEEFIPYGSLPQKLERTKPEDIYWMRYPISDGVEVHVRSDVLDRDRGEVEQWIDKIRKMKYSEGP